MYLMQLIKYVCYLLVRVEVCVYFINWRCGYDVAMMIVRLYYGIDIEEVLKMLMMMSCRISFGFLVLSGICIWTLQIL